MFFGLAFFFIVIRWIFFIKQTVFTTFYCPNKILKILNTKIKFLQKNFRYCYNLFIDCSLILIYFLNGILNLCWKKMVFNL